MSIKDNVIKLLKPMQTTMLATCCNNQPYVRPMILIYHQGRFYFASGTADAKSKQIEQNPLAETCTMYEHNDDRGYFRSTGYLKNITDVETRKELHAVAGFIRNYFPEPDDPGFALYEMIWQKVEFMEAGQTLTESEDW
jgi:uncharacterized pyridoxamine 5'-phosphate oxidase family protein